MTWLGPQAYSSASGMLWFDDHQNWMSLDTIPNTLNNARGGIIVTPVFTGANVAKVSIIVPPSIKVNFAHLSSGALPHNQEVPFLINHRIVGYVPSVVPRGFNTS